MSDPTVLATKVCTRPMNDARWVCKYMYVEMYLEGGGVFFGCVVGWVRGAKDRRLPYSRVRCAKARCVDQVRIGGSGPWLASWLDWEGCEATTTQRLCCVLRKEEKVRWVDCWDDVVGIDGRMERRCGCFILGLALLLLIPTWVEVW